MRVEGHGFTGNGPCSILVTLSQVRTGPGPEATVVHVQAESGRFSFFLRDVMGGYPIFIPEYAAAVVPGDDERDYGTVAASIGERGLAKALDQIEDEPEESFAKAAPLTRDMRCPTWLGLSRDMRLFEVYTPEDEGRYRCRPDRLHAIVPKRHNREVPLPDADGKEVRYFFWLGRGKGPDEPITRRLDQGVLPILHMETADDGIHYETEMFCSLERTPLTQDNLRGTHYVVANGEQASNRTPEQDKLLEKLLPTETERDEETVLYCRVRMRNTGAVPRYAFILAPVPGSDREHEPGHGYNCREGFGIFSEDRVFCTNRLDDAPMPQREISLLIAPGDVRQYEFRVPHRPLSASRARALAEQDFDARLEECRSFWQNKLDRSAGIRIPEKRVDEMIRAGLLHLDLITYGLEPGGVLGPTIGSYQPIASESGPIIQFYHAMGWHDVARRSVAYFLECQRENGKIINWYDVETGAALYLAGEHYRYTRDTEWVRSIKTNIHKACDFLLEWRQANRIEELRGMAYGLIDGKACDPDDPWHIFMVNGYACMGLTRAAELLEAIEDARADEIRTAASEYKADIRIALEDAMARSPVVPLGDGTWCPTAPPWAEGASPSLLFATDELCFSHGTFTLRDSIAGPLYLPFQEVLDPGEQAVQWLLDFHTELLATGNVAFSQPYYSRHAWVCLRQGKVKAFLKAYYRTFAALADRETYTFWEHFYHISPHKTHEEGWFLMQTRWLLYMDDTPDLRLLPGAPRAWFAPGQKLELERVHSLFGPFTLRVETNGSSAEAGIQLHGERERWPERVLLRLPNHDGAAARDCKGGTYDASAETVLVEMDKEGAGKVRLEF